MPHGTNIVVLVGNLTRDPDLRHTQNGTAVCTCQMATNTESRKKDDGQWEDLAQFHRVVVWGPTGEALGQNGKKGDAIEILGMLTQRSWDDQQTGQKRYVTEVKASMVKLRPKEGGNSAGARHNKPPSNASSYQVQQGGGYDDGDIPF